MVGIRRSMETSNFYELLNFSLNLILFCRQLLHLQLPQQFWRKEENPGNQRIEECSGSSKEYTGNLLNTGEYWGLFCYFSIRYSIPLYRINHIRQTKCSPICITFRQMYCVYGIALVFYPVNTVCTIRVSVCYIGVILI